MSEGIRTEAELEARVTRAVGAAKSKPGARSERERILEIQNKALRDRLALVLAMFHDGYVNAGIEGDFEAAEWWEQRRRAVIAQDVELLRSLREAHADFYKLAMSEVGEWLERGVKAVLARLKGKEAA